MTKLDKAVAIAMGMEVQQDKEQIWWVKVDQCGDRGTWTWLDGWANRINVADELMDAHHIDAEWFSRKWSATCGGVVASHSDRKTAALMAFCKHKGVAYE